MLRRHPAPFHAAGPVAHEAVMDPVEAQGRAIIAAALIVRGAVEVPSMPSRSQQLPDEAGVRLRELTEYVYRLVTTDHPGEPE